MAGLPTTVWFDNRQYASIRAMVCAVTSSLIEKHETVIFQQRIYLAEVDATGTVPHAVN